MAMLTNALQNAWKHPFGLGWTGIGWSHSDFSQEFANLGFLAGSIFLGAYSVTLFRLWKQRWNVKNAIFLDIF